MPPWRHIYIPVLGDGNKVNNAFGNICPLCETFSAIVNTYFVVFSPYLGLNCIEKSIINQRSGQGGGPLAPFVE